MATVSYGLKITKENHIFDHTIKFYRDAVNYLVGIALSHYPELKEINDSEKATAGQLRRQYVEWLVHSTKGNEAAYPYFDQHFYKMHPIFAVMRSQLQSGKYLHTGSG